jgi:hypothetical protein
MAALPDAVLSGDGSTWKPRDSVYTRMDVYEGWIAGSPGTRKSG